MILVLCGTQRQDFSRMIRAVETISKREKVIVQGGHNHYKSKDLEIFGFLSQNQLQKLYEKADYIITHAGAGSMIQALKNGKRTIAFPRLQAYGEHVNNHQLELALKFERMGYLLVCRDGDDLQKIFEKAKTFIPKPYHLKGNIVEMIDRQLEEIF